MVVLDGAITDPMFAARKEARQSVPASHAQLSLRLRLLPTAKPGYDANVTYYMSLEETLAKYGEVAVSRILTPLAS